MGIIIPTLFSKLPVRAFFTDRETGSEVSEIAAVSGFVSSNIFLPIQKHTSDVQIVYRGSEPAAADAAVTCESGLLVGVRTADCMPILMCDKSLRAVCAVHAGWRGTAKGIIKNAVSLMHDKFSVPAEDLLIAVGPCIKRSCYEVGPEVVEALEEATGKGDYIDKQGDKYHIDLPSANRLQALSLGVLAGHIEISKDCTYCMPQKYYSYRYSKETSGRQAGFIGKL